MEDQACGNETPKCAHCKSDPAVFICTCCNALEPCCWQCITKHMLNNRNDAHCTLPLHAAKYKSPRDFSAKAECLKSRERELQLSLASMNELLEKMNESINEAVERIKTFQSAFTAKLLEEKEKARKEVQAAVSESEACLKQAQSPILPLTKRLLQDQPGILEGFTYTFSLQT